MPNHLNYSEMTKDELTVLVAFREHELRTEWCATLILPQIQAIQAELAKRP